MTYGVDTSVLLRVLTGQPVALAQKVRARLKDLWRSGVRCSVCDVVVSEAYYALQVVIARFYFYCFMPQDWGVL